MALPPDTNNRNQTLADRQAAQQDVFLREVDDALREDDLRSLATRYGKPVGGAVLAGLLALAGYLYWDHSTKQAAAERSERLILALDKVDTGPAAAATAVKDLKALAKDGPAGNKYAAAMLVAGLAQQQGNGEDAAKQFAAISADASAPQPFRDMAAIREMAIRFDTVPPQQVVDRLKPLAVPGNPWFGSAAELVGMAYLKQNKPDLAGPLLATAATNTEVPASLRSRLRDLAGQLGYEGSGDTPALTSDAATR